MTAAFPMISEMNSTLFHFPGLSSQHGRILTTKTVISNTALHIANQDFAYCMKVKGSLAFNATIKASSICGRSSIQVPTADRIIRISAAFSCKRVPSLLTRNFAMLARNINTKTKIPTIANTKIAVFKFSALLIPS